VYLRPKDQDLNLLKLMDWLGTHHSLSLQIWTLVSLKKTLLLIDLNRGSTQQGVQLPTLHSANHVTLRVFAAHFSSHSNRVYSGYSIFRILTATGCRT
jgi:hypothetical protein